MKLFLKYLLWFLSFLTILFYYFANTYVGNLHISHHLSQYLSKKTQNNISLYYLDFQNYPKLKMRMKVNKTADLNLEGQANREEILMKYHLWGDSFHFNKIELKDRVDVKGNLFGSISKLFVTGEGELFDGESDYSFLKTSNSFKDINLKLKDVNSSKLMSFLNKKSLFEGRADINANLTEYSSLKKEGTVNYSMADGRVVFKSKVLPLTFNSKINLRGHSYDFDIDMNSTIGKIHFFNGTHNQAKKAIFSEYSVDIYDLGYFEKELRRKYSGGFKAKGRMSYGDSFKVDGDSDKFDGNLHFYYDESDIELRLKDVSLTKLLKAHNYPTILQARVYGKIDYDIVEKMLFFDTKLKKLKLAETKITNMILSKTGIDLMGHIYDKSSFNGAYQNSLLSALFKIDDGEEHIYLKEIKMNSKSNSINSKFEVMMQGQEIFGEIYGTLDSPKVSVDMNRLIRYQVGKRFGGLLGNKNRKDIKKGINSLKESLEDVDVEDVKNKAKSMIKDFF